MTAVLALVLSLAAQAGELELDAHALHREAVRAERCALFFDAWFDADDAGRARARRTLERLRSPGASAVAAPDTETVTRAWRALLEPPADGDRDATRAQLQRFADALDLRVRPGWFPASRDGKGEPLTVAVAPIHALTPPREVEVELWWERPEDPRGGLRARREPFSAQSFEDGGFDMFVRSPLGAAGVWHLVPVLERGGERVRGVPVPVEGLGVELLVPDEPPGPPARHAWTRMELQRQLGVRPASGHTPSLLRRSLVDPDLWSGAGALPLPLAEAPYASPGGGSEWLWIQQLQSSSGCALLLLAPSTDAPEAVLAGELGRRWVRACEQLGASALFALRPPGPQARELAAAELFDWLVGTVRERAGDVPLVVVARGDALPWLEVAALGRDELPFDAVLATSAAAGTPRTGLAGVPLLMLAPDGPESIERSDGGYDWVRGDRLLLLDEPRLPELAAQWLPLVLAGADAAEDDERR